MLSHVPRLSALLAQPEQSFVFDYVVRQKMAVLILRTSSSSSFPFLPPPTDDERAARFIESRVLELTYTAWDMEPFARDLGDDGPPFRWDEDRRFVMRAELDAAFFHLYGIDRDDVDYIMETFPIVKRKDIAAPRHLPHQGQDPRDLRRDGQGHQHRHRLPDDPHPTPRPRPPPSRLASSSCIPEIAGGCGVGAHPFGKTKGRGQRVARARSATESCRGHIRSGDVQVTR